MGDGAAKTEFIRDTEIDVYGGLFSMPLSLEDVDISAFDSGAYPEETTQFFYDKMYDVDSDMDIKREHCMIIHNNGDILCANRGTKDACGFTQQQISDYAEGATILHSHPPVDGKGDAGTFSGTDIASMGVGETRQVVTGPEGIYVLDITSYADVEGFKKAIADSKLSVNQALIAIRKEAADEWIKSGGIDSTREEAMRNCINKQKMYWSETIGKFAAMHGIEYTFHPDADALQGKKSGYIPNTKLAETSDYLKNKQMARQGYASWGMYTDSDGRNFVYLKGKKRESIVLGFGAVNEELVLKGTAADAYAEKSVFKNWFSILNII